MVRVASQSPNQREAVTAVNSATFRNEYLYSTNHALNVNATISGNSATSTTVTSVASSATNVTLLAANSTRRAATFYNDSTQILYLKLGVTASSSSYTVQMAAGSYYEVPQPCYTGEIDGIWASANGNVRITEVTP